MKEVARATWGVFGVSEESRISAISARPIPKSDLPQLDHYVDALGEPIDGGASFPGGDFAVVSSEEVWGVDAARVAQSRIAQARRFRDWALK
jgi:tRNA threonylcarbamoyladenosine dehydratase